MEQLLRLVDQWKALLAAIGLLLTAGIGIWQELLKLNPWSWSWHELSFAVLASALLALLAFRSRKAHASRLVDPEALRLDPQVPEQLVGRGGDLKLLLNALANPLVFLVSESGCGKSALLRAGVAQDAAFTTRFLPVYVDMSVLDWEEGPLRALRDEFSRALPTDDPARGRLDTHSEPEGYSEVFYDFYKRTLRRPLLLLDQFDDFQAQPRHRERFLPGETRVWRNADTIAQKNAFWRVLRQCLQNGRLLIIVACREEAAKGLESVRFQPDVQQFDLPRLEPGLVRMVIDRLTERPADKPAVIADPQGGWTTLRDRLVGDLEARGHVLPQQLKVVLGGLRTLRRLTPAAYARIGRLGGLEAASVAGAMARAARAATLSDEDVLRLLLPLIDRTRQPPDKAQPKTTAELAALARVREDLAVRALDRLKSDEIVRPLGNSEAEATRWQLDHAYLALPILRIERERDQWRWLLEERAHAFAEAAWRDKWSSLLPIRTQFQLLVARSQRRFRYGEHRGYALKSLARGLPSVVAFGLIAAFVWTFNEYDAASRLESQFAADSADLTEDAAAALDDLTTRGVVTRWRLARDAFSSPIFAGWFAKTPEPILRALVRLDPDRLDALVRGHVTAEALRQRDIRLRAASSALIRTASRAALADGTKVAFQRALTEALTGDLTDVDVGAVAGGVRIVAGWLPSGDPRGAEWLAMLRIAISKSTGSDQLKALSDAYTAVAAMLRDGDARTADEFSALLGAVNKSSNSDQVEALVDAYKAMATKLKDGDTHLPEMLATFRNSLGFATGFAGISTYGALAAGLKSGEPRAADKLFALRGEIAKTTNSFRLELLADAYSTVAAKLSDGDSHSADELTALRDVISKLTDSDQLQALTRAYVAVAAKLRDGDPHSADELTALRDMISKPTTPDQLGALTQAYAVVAAKLKGGDPRAADVLGVLRNAMIKNVGFPGLQALTDAYVAVASALKDGDSHAVDILTAVREKIGNTTGSFSLGVLVETYAAVATKLRDGDPHAEDELSALRDAISKSSEYGQLGASARAYAAVIGKSNRDAAEVLAVLLDRVGTATEGEKLGVLSPAYAAIVSKFKGDDPRAADALPIFRKGITASFMPSELKPLTENYVVAREECGDG